MLAAGYIYCSGGRAGEGSDTIALTHGQIARYMGSARVAVSGMLKYFFCLMSVYHFRIIVSVMWSHFLLYILSVSWFP